MQLQRMSTPDQRYHQVTARILSACERAHRSASEVSLLAVSKTKPAEMVQAIYNEGHRHFGENYLQDALEKIETLAHLEDIQWHFIGPLQSNKTRPVAEHFHWVETVDRRKIATRLNDQRPEHLKALNVLIQVNVSGEEQKSGISPEDVPELAAAIGALPRLTLRGLMCIPEATQDEQKLASQFRILTELLPQLQQDHPSCDTLSMGMSGDLEPAIASGSTQVRIGTDIFGARN